MPQHAATFIGLRREAIRRSAFHARHDPELTKVSKRPVGES